MQRAGDVIHIVAERFTDLTHCLADLTRGDTEMQTKLVKSRDFH